MKLTEVGWNTNLSKLHIFLPILTSSFFLLWLRLTLTIGLCVVQFCLSSYLWEITLPLAMEVVNFVVHSYLWLQTEFDCIQTYYSVDSSPLILPLRYLLGICHFLEKMLQLCHTVSPPPPKVRQSVDTNSHSEASGRLQMPDLWDKVKIYFNDQSVVFKQ